MAAPVYRSALARIAGLFRTRRRSYRGIGIQRTAVLARERNAPFYLASVVGDRFCESYAGAGSGSDSMYLSGLSYFEIGIGIIGIPSRVAIAKNRGPRTTQS